MPEIFSDLTTLSLIKSLDGLGIRHRVIADNIANVETPGFIRSEVSFEDSLKLAMESGDKREIRKSLEKVQPEVVPDLTSAMRPNSNNVSIDKEMADLSKNALHYEALIQIINLKSVMLRAAITEGRR